MVAVDGNSTIHEIIRGRSAPCGGSAGSPRCRQIYVVRQPKNGGCGCVLYLLTLPEKRQNHLLLGYSLDLDDSSAEFEDRVIAHRIPRKELSLILSN